MQKMILTLREAITKAAKLEKFLKNNGKFKNRITTLYKMEDEELEEKDLDEEKDQSHPSLPGKTTLLKVQ